MLKSIFTKSSPTTDLSAEALQIANLALLSRMAQVLQAATRNQEKHSTVLNLRPLTN
jgi:hypothetical protein